MLIFLIPVVWGIGLTAFTSLVESLLQDHQEPPYIFPLLPFVGHGIGLFWNRARYYIDVK